MPTIIGEHLLKKTEDKRERRVGAVFLSNNVAQDNMLVLGNGLHGLVYRDYVNLLNQKRKEKGLRPVTQEEKDSIFDRYVDLYMKGTSILIKPNAEKIELAFEADEFLQEIVPKHKIKYLGVLDDRIRQAIKQKGECWRINTLPKTNHEMVEEIYSSVNSISNGKMYYHSAETGTRYLTFHEFSKLEKLDSEALADCLDEIKTYSQKTNRRGNPEIDFFMADDSFGYKDFEGIDFKKLDKVDLRRIYDQLRGKFQDSVKPELRADNPWNLEWRTAMLASLIRIDEKEEISEEILLGLCPEFFMHIQWLPGARFEHGEIIFDSVFDKKEKHPDNKDLEQLCDEKVKGFIFNFLREYNQIEYINIGRVDSSLSQRDPMPGRRGVYIAEIKIPEKEEEIVKVIRMQKRSVREYLQQGYDLPNAVLRSERDTEYKLDRHVGCKQLGINVGPIKAGKVNEKFEDTPIRSTYFERDYIYGIATDKISRSKFTNPEYSRRFAELLGQSAALNIIIGRVFEKKVLFDDGDEVIIEENGLPSGIVLADLTATFRDYNTGLSEFVKAYAEPVKKRLNHVPDKADFIDAYVSAFMKRFNQAKQEYQTRKNAFDNLFIDKEYFEEEKQLEKGFCFAYRWKKVLERLEKTDPKQLGELIRCQIK